jgi:hypothetical protein
MSKIFPVISETKILDFRLRKIIDFSIIPYGAVLESKRGAPVRSSGVGN